MSLVICDTNIFISLFKERPHTMEELKNIGDAFVYLGNNGRLISIQIVR